MKYGPQEHKKAYELWRAGWSFQRISSLPGMPDRREIRDWAKPGYHCNCGWHGWIDLRLQELRARRSGEPVDLPPEPAPAEESPPPSEENAAWANILSPKILKALSEATGIEISEENAAWANILSPKILKALSEATGIEISEELSGDLEADMISTAYLILFKAREALKEMEIRDPFALRQLLGVAVQILTIFRPVVSTAREDITEIEVRLPNYPRGYGHKDEDEQV